MAFSTHIPEDHKVGVGAVIWAEAKYVSTLFAFLPYSQQIWAVWQTYSFHNSTSDLQTYCMYSCFNIQFLKSSFIDFQDSSCTVRKTDEPFWYLFNDGCVVVVQGRCDGTGRLYLVGCGYNAYPVGSEYAEYPQMDNKQQDRQRRKYRYIVHAEQNALTFR